MSCHCRGQLCLRRQELPLLSHPLRPAQPPSPLQLHSQLPLRLAAGERLARQAPPLQRPLEQPVLLHTQGRLPQEQPGRPAQGRLAQRRLAQGRALQLWAGHPAAAAAPPPAAWPPGRLSLAPGASRPPSSTARLQERQGRGMHSGWYQLVAIHWRGVRIPSLVPEGTCGSQAGFGGWLAGQGVWRTCHLAAQLLLALALHLLHGKGSDPEVAGQFWAQPRAFSQHTAHSSRATRRQPVRTSTNENESAYKGGGGEGPALAVQVGTKAPSTHLSM